MKTDTSKNGKNSIAEQEKFNLDAIDNWEAWMEEKTKIHLNKRKDGGKWILMVWGMFDLTVKFSLGF